MIIRRVFRSVLVADDELVCQMLAVAMLESLGCVVDVVDDGDAAVTRVLAGSYDAVLMDYRMPRMDGLAATREIRRMEGNGRRTPIVAYTACATPDDHEACLAAGMDGFLAKPMTIAALSSLLEALWATATSDRELCR